MSLSLVSRCILVEYIKRDDQSSGLGECCWCWGVKIQKKGVKSFFLVTVSYNSQPGLFSVHSRSLRWLLRSDLWRSWSSFVIIVTYIIYVWFHPNTDRDSMNKHTTKQERKTNTNIIMLIMRSVCQLLNWLLVSKSSGSVSPCRSFEGETSHT